MVRQVDVLVLVTKLGAMIVRDSKICIIFFATILQGLEIIVEVETVCEGAELGKGE